MISLSRRRRISDLHVEEGILKPSPLAGEGRVRGEFHHAVTLAT
jgi:hypothetical protein